LRSKVKESQFLYGYALSLGLVIGLFILSVVCSLLAGTVQEVKHTEFNRNEELSVFKSATYEGYRELSQLHTLHCQMSGRDANNMQYIYGFHFC
jgi:ABC-type lipoprotein release transport system permease subunit